MELLLAVGAEIELAVEAGARGPPNLGQVRRWRAAALALTQRLVLLQTAGRLDRKQNKFMLTLE